MRLMIAMALLVLGMPVSAGDRRVPVIIGDQHPDLDACSSYAEIEQKASTPLRAGPGEKYPTLGQLSKGQRLFVCSTSADGKWLGVVLDMNGFLDCGVTSPVSPPRAYTGPCQSGWVRATTIRLIAG